MRHALIALILANFLVLPIALAESGSSTNYRLDYGRLTSDSDQKTSASYRLTDSISDISVEGDSASYALRNVYSSPAAGAPVCGNGTIETGEQCEGVNFGGLSCASYGFNSGTLQCASCLIVTTGCFNAGGGGGSVGGSGYLCAGAYCWPETTKPPTPPELTFAPSIDETLTLPSLVLPAPAPIPPIEPVTPSVPPVSPPLHPTAPEEVRMAIAGAYDFHFEQYSSDQTVTILDETPFIATKSEPNAIYEMVITDENGAVVTRQGVKSTAEGVLMFESIPFLEYKTYTILLYDRHRTINKTWTIKIEDQPYREHDNLLVNKELDREIISLGSFEKLTEISGNGELGSKYHAYLQHIEKQGSRVAKIEHLTSTANSHGQYQLTLPPNLKSGPYLLQVVQVYEDGKVSRNKRYTFDLQPAEKPWNIWVPLSILIVYLLGQLMRTTDKKGKISIKNLLAATVILSLIIHKTIAFAAVTTPSVFIYEGKLLDSSNNPITTPQTFRFSLWNSDDLVAGDITGAGAINVAAPAYGGWFETHTLTPNSDGTFFAELGSVTPLPNMLLSTHKDLMVEIKPSAAPDTSYELMDPSGDNGADLDDRQTVGSTPYTNNADLIDNAELGTGAGNIATLGLGGIWDINYMPGGTNSDSWTVDMDNTVGAGGTIDLVFGNTLAQTLAFDITNDWFSFSNDVDFGQNQIKNVAIDNLAAAPGAPVAGQIYHNTTDGNTYVWNGVSWDDITAGATGVDDLDGVYGADADKKMAVNNVSGLEFESSVAGDIVVDLQSTGDFVIQDSGSPFVIFTDGGDVGIGTTTPQSKLQVDSGAVNTTPIFTLGNTAGDLQFFRTDATPEGAVTGSIGDLAVDGTNGTAYIKNSGNATNTGWLQFGGQANKTAVFNVEYSDATIQGDGTNNKGLLSSYFVDSGGTSKYNYYEWTTKQTSLQDVDITLSFRLPQDFISFTANPLSILYQTSNGVIATNQLDVFLYDTTGAAVALTAGTDLANGAWTTAGITFGGAPTFTAGNVVTLVIKLQTLSAGYARVSDVIFNYNGN